MRTALPPLPAATSMRPPQPPVRSSGWKSAAAPLTSSTSYVPGLLPCPPGLMWKWISALIDLDFGGFFNKTLNSDEYSPKLSEKEPTIASLFTNNQKILKEQWLKLLDDRVNGRKRLCLAAQYYDDRIASKLFVEWKLCVKTKKFQSKLMTKSLCSLRESMSKSGGAFKHIRLSHSNQDFANYLKLKSQNENENEDESYNEFDSVLLRTPNFDRLNDWMRDGGI